MPAIDNVLAHFSGLEGWTVEVPEWELTIHCKPQTLNQRRALLKSTRDNDEVDAAVEALILLSLDEDGKRIFSKEDKPKILRGADPDVLLRVVGGIMGSDGEAAPGES